MILTRPLKYSNIVKNVKMGDLMTKTKLKSNYIVTKKNALNEMRSREMNLQELRLFSVYLSKINPKDPSTRLVKFSLADFQAIMDLGRLNIAYFKKIAYGLVRKTIDVPIERGGFTVFNIFRMFRVFVDENNEWCVEIDVDDEALPLIFDLKGYYFKYELWNALHLKGKNQLRMYEILKQHEKIGSRIIKITDLKGMLGINENEYPQYKHFRQYVLEACKKALSQNTDISFTYEPHSKKGRKIYEIKFTISKNKDYEDPLHLDKFISLKNDNLESEDGFSNITEAGYIETNQNHGQIDLTDIDENGNVRSTGKHHLYEERIVFLQEACDNEFSREEMVVLYSVMQKKIPDIHFDAMKSHDYLQHKYREMEMNDKRLKIRGEKIGSRFAYFRKMLENDD